MEGLIFWGILFLIVVIVSNWNAIVEGIKAIFMMLAAWALVAGGFFL
jgi:hypothetical protein